MDDPNFTVSIVWCLFCCIFESLHFLSIECKLWHGNISFDAIGVTWCGSWKLAGYELCCLLGNNYYIGRYFYDNSCPYPELYCSPDRAARS